MEIVPSLITQTEKQQKAIHVVTYGKVPQQIIDASETAMRDIAKYMQFNDDLPELHLSEGPLELPSGEIIRACYEANPGDIPKIRFGLSTITEPSKSSKVATVAKYLISPFVRFNCPPKILIAAHVAHETVHHIQAQRGVALLSSPTKLADLHKNEPTEQEANNIAKEVTRKRYGWIVSL